MLDFTKNINENDRIVRAVIGFVLIVASALGFGRYFMVLAGLALIAEGAIGWCGIRALMGNLSKCCPMNKCDDKTSAATAEKDAGSETTTEKNKTQE